MKKKAGYITLLHISCWAIFFSLPIIFLTWESNTRLIDLMKPGLVYFFVYVVIFYLHTNLLFPRLYFGKKYFLYFISIFLLAAAVFYLRPFDKLTYDKHSSEKRKVNNYQPHLPPPGNFPPNHDFNSPDSDRPRGTLFSRPGPKLDIVSVVFFILVIAVSITIIIIKRWRIAVKAVARAEADKANAELSNLKAQIHPHFLFNTLNNIYSQAIMQDEHTAESILKLSNIMRYVTDDATQNFVSLQSEINFISDYIALQKLRLGSKTLVNYTVSGNPDKKLIAPLILITFIENVFKYGSSNSEPSIITIDLKAAEHTIDFFCRNTLFPSKPKLESTGIGIMNTTKRLAYLYKDKYLLNIEEESGFYSVYLTLRS